MSAPVLLRFLGPFEEFLATRGIASELATRDLVALRGLHQVLARFDPEMPLELQQALLDIADVATENAHEHLLAVVRERGADLPLEGKTVEDATFELFMARPEVFRSVHARVQSADVRRFVEYQPSTPSVGSLDTSPSKLEQLERVVGEWFRLRNRTSFCEVIGTRDGGEITFQIVHGRCPASLGTIRDGRKRHRSVVVRDKHDFVVFDGATGRLSINAQFAAELEFYRCAFGEVFFGSANHFTVRPVFTAAPLSTDGLAVFAAHGLEDVEDVVLRQVRVLMPGHGGAVCELKAPDLRDLLDSPLGRLVFQAGEVKSLRFDLRLAGVRRPLSVQLELPNKLTYDRREGCDVVRLLLQRCGFERPPTTEGSADRGAVL